MRTVCFFLEYFDQVGYCCHAGKEKKRIQFLYTTARISIGKFSASDSNDTWRIDSGQDNGQCMMTEGPSRNL